MSKKNKKKKNICDQTELFEKITFADVGKTVLRREDEICKGPLFHMRNKVITEEEKITFRYKIISTQYLETVIDHNSAMRFLFSDQ